MIIFKRSQGQKNEPKHEKKKGKTVGQECKRRIKAEEGRKRQIGKKEQRLNMTSIEKGST